MFLLATVSPWPMWCGRVTVRLRLCRGRDPLHRQLLVTFYRGGCRVGVKGVCPFPPGWILLFETNRQDRREHRNVRQEVRRLLLRGRFEISLLKLRIRHRLRLEIRLACLRRRAGVGVEGSFLPGTAVPVSVRPDNSPVLGLMLVQVGLVGRRVVIRVRVRCGRLRLVTPILRVMGLVMRLRRLVVRRRRTVLVGGKVACWVVTVGRVRKARVPALVLGTIPFPTPTLRPG